MIMGFPLRFRYLSILQVVIIVICHQGKVSSEKAQGCVGSQLSLRCPEMKVIQITTVVLGDTKCYGRSCCIKANDCTHAANANHRTDVIRRCDNKTICTVGVLQEKIPCGFFSSSNNDFERITYNCIDEPRNASMNYSTYEEPKQDNYDPDLDTEMAHGCVGSKLNLSCGEMKVIEVMDVVLGDSLSTGITCEIKDNNCTHNANANHTMDVHRRCDNQSNCIVEAIQELINCWALNSSTQNDFELITYNCLNDSRDSLTSTDETVTVTTIPYNTPTEAVSATVTDEHNSQALNLVTVIICPIILLAIILAIIVVMHRRKKYTRMKTLLDPVALTEVDHHQNEYDIYSNETQGTSINGDKYAQPMCSLIDEADSPHRDENQTVYSEVELRQAIWKDGQSDRVTTGKHKAAIETNTPKSDVYAAVSKPTGIVSKAPTPQDDGGLTLIENDLYGMTNNCAKEIAAETPAYLLARAVSKTSTSQDDEGLTVIENDLYSH